jgi:catechol 2,3-dioxygenase-like lactoylglutathione lyase family enzyme
MDRPLDGLHYGVVGVTDLEASLEFYCGLLKFSVAGRSSAGAGRCLLTSGGRFLVLQGLGGQPAPSAWVNDDLQAGMRHIGLKVDDVDSWAERLRDSGVRFTVEPEDAFGDVRLCFFLDPDGTHLEFVQGNVQYNNVWSPDLVAAERAIPVPGTPRFDHVAVSVTDLDATLAFYHDQLGFPVLGQLREDNPGRGFGITFVQAGPGVLEIFTFTDPMQANSFRPGPPAPGLLHLGFGAADVPAAAAGLTTAGASPATAAGTVPDGSVLAADPDGTPLEIGPVPQQPEAAGLT